MKAFQKLIGVVDLMTTSNSSVDPYWAILSIFKRLKLECYEYDRGTNKYHITVPAFGMLFRTNPSSPASLHFKDWDIIDINLKEVLDNQGLFTDELIWDLVAKGYFSYLRQARIGAYRTYRSLLFDFGWAQKIIQRRLEAWGDEPRHRYKIEQNKFVLTQPNTIIEQNYSDFFDSLM